MPERWDARRWCEKKYQYVALAAAGGGLLFWLVLWGCPWYLLPLNYLGVILFPLGLAWWAACRLPRLHIFLSIVGAGTALVLLVCWFGWDSYASRWEEGDVHYRDTVQRWTGKVTHRILYRRGGEWYEEGPISPSGSPHGQWYIEDDLGHRYQWFWYGKKVSEGEFHRSH